MNHVLLPATPGPYVARRAAYPDAMAKRRLIASDEAVGAKSQITKPCSDCPLSRGSLNGWLGGGTPEDWGHALHSESRMNCHVLEGAQCAGAAIYRGNICKRLMDKGLLVLPADHEAVFSNRAEFLTHHTAPLAKKA